MKLTHRMCFWGVSAKLGRKRDLGDTTIKILHLKIEAENLSQIHLELFITTVISKVCEINPK